MSPSTGKVAKSQAGLAVAGVLAGGVAGEILRPLRDLRETLAELVERLDRFSLEARGPANYPWSATTILREELAAAYLVCRRVTRLADDLSAAVNQQATAAETVDVNKLVESAMNLARHRISATTEVFIDLGTVPLVRAVPGDMVLFIAQLLVIAADSAHHVEGTAISIKTRREHDEQTDSDSVVVYVADNGEGCPEEAEAARQLISGRLKQVAGTFEGTSERGSGSVFELRLPVDR